MDLPQDEAGFLALELRCASPHSANSKRTVAQLKQSKARKHLFFEYAVQTGLSNLVRCALEAGVSAALRFEERAMPLVVNAAGKGHPRIVKQLLEAGADHSATSTSQACALLTAAEGGHLECIELLLAAGVDANICNLFGRTPLMAAITFKHTECAEALLCASDLHIKTDDGMNAFHVCVLTANEECFELLLPRMSDVDVRTAKPRIIPTLLAAGLGGMYHLAQPSGDEDIPFNSTPLHLACGRGLQKMANALLKRGAERMARQSRKTTPLHLAARHGHLSCVVLLVGRPGKFKLTPAEVDAVDVQGNTALIFAVQGGYDKICGVLIGAGARLDAMTSGFTPLMAAQHFHPTNAPLLALLSGTCPAQLPGTFCDHCGKTAEQASVPCLKTCGACHGMRYCSTACSYVTLRDKPDIRAAAWPGHKAACKARVAEREQLTKVHFLQQT